MKRTCLTLLLAFITLSLFSCLSPTPKVHSDSSYYFFDTKSEIFSYAGDSEASFKENSDLAFSLLCEYHGLFDIYNESYGTNNLATVNRLAGIEAVEVDRKIIDFLLYAKEIHELTSGEVNIAMGAVTRLWHDARVESLEGKVEPYIPGEEELREAEKHTSIDLLVIDEESSTVYLSDSEASLDVGALAKGYVAERVAEALTERGVTSYALNFGGNLRIIGKKPSGEGWVVGVTNPDTKSPDPFVTRVNISDTSLVTSGNYERFYTVGGVNYHHIIDKDTLMPSAYFSSVSVMTEDSALGDALSTALFSMPYEEGRALAERLSVDVFWVDLEYRTYSTEGFDTAESEK